MKAWEILEDQGFYHCPECRCAIGDDWEFVDFSDKTVIECPQCKERVYLDYATGKVRDCPNVA